MSNYIHGVCRDCWHRKCVCKPAEPSPEVPAPDDSAELAEAKRVIERWAAGFENDDIVKAYRTLLRKVDELTRRNASSLARYEAHAVAIVDLTAERDELRAKLAEAEGMWRSSDGRRASAVERAEAAEEKLAEAEKRIDKLKEALTDALTQKATSERDYEEECATRRQFQEANRDHFARAEDAERCNANLVAQLSAVIERAEDAEARVKELEQHWSDND